MDYLYDENNINIKLLAQNITLKKDVLEEYYDGKSKMHQRRNSFTSTNLSNAITQYNKIHHMNPVDLKEYLMDQAVSPHPHNKANFEENVDEKLASKSLNKKLVFNDSDGSNSVNQSVLEEYWEDFNTDNQLKENKECPKEDTINRKQNIEMNGSFAEDIKKLDYVKREMMLCKP